MTAPYNPSFQISVTPDPSLPDAFFYFQEGKLLHRKAENIALLWQKMPLEVTDQELIGQLEGQNCYAANLVEGQELPEGAELSRLRALFDVVSNEQIMAAGIASQVLHWAGRHRFCGKCGSRMQDRERERAKVCRECSTVYYPEIHPAVIMAITKGDKILLGHANRFNRKFYSVLAGFLEIGETFEECVRREVREEAGIEVKNIRYFGSQPWPFPSSMMVGFTAEWASGDIQIDPEELTDADWYTADEMPPVPSTVSIAGRLIRWFVETQRKSNTQPNL